MLPPRSKRRIGRAVGNGKPMIRLGFLDGLESFPQVWPRIESNLPGGIQSHDLIREVEAAGNIKLLHRRSIVQQREELDLSCAQIDFRGLQIGFILRPLYFKTVQINLSDRACLIALTIHVQNVVVIQKVFPGQAENSLFLERLNECVSQIEHESSFQIRLSRDRDLGRILSALEPQFPLVSPFMQVAEVWRLSSTGERLPDSLRRRDLNAIDGHSKVRIRADIRRNLLGSRFVDADLPRPQRRIRLLELVSNFLPGQRSLRQTAARGKGSQEERKQQAPGKHLH